jgi:hypothetical protein
VWARSCAATYIRGSGQVRSGGVGAERAGAASRMLHCTCTRAVEELRCGWTFFQVAWLDVRKPGWVRAGGVCARSGVQCSAVQGRVVLSCGTDYGLGTTERSLFSVSIGVFSQPFLWLFVKGSFWKLPIPPMT